MLFRKLLGTRLKMALVVRTDLSMQKGKIASQVAHAAVQLALQRDESVDKWLMQGQPKIVLKISSLIDLEELQRQADLLGVRNQAVFDAGNTQVPSGTLTVLGLGPADEEAIAKVVGHLKLL